jgi:hypothetical protein
MSNVVADQAKLVINAFAAQFENNLTTARAVTWKQDDREMDDTNKLQIVDQFPPRYNVYRTQGGVRDISGGTQTSVFGSELYAVTGTFGTDMGWGDFQAITTMGEAKQSVALRSAAVNLAEQIDAYVMRIATLASIDWVGTMGANVSSHLDAMQAFTRLKEGGVPENDLSYIFNHTDEMLLGDQVIKLPAPDAMATAAYRRGFDSTISGVPTLFTNQLPVLTTGTRAITGAGAINGASQNVDYVNVANQTTVNGLYLSQNIAVDGLAAGATIAAGEVFTVPGVFAYDNRKQALVQPVRLQQFTVVEAATASGAGAIAAMRIAPAMIVPGSGAGANIAINTAQANVSAAPADNAVLTFLGAASTGLAPRLLIHKEAIRCYSARLRMPSNSPDARRVSLRKIPLSVRMWPHSDHKTGAHAVRFDVAMDANIHDRRLISRVNGS